MPIRDQVASRWAKCLQPLTVETLPPVIQCNLFVKPPYLPPLPPLSMHYYLIFGRPSALLLGGLCNILTDPEMIGLILTSHLCLYQLCLYLPISWSVALSLSV